MKRLFFLFALLATQILWAQHPSRTWTSNTGQTIDSSFRSEFQGKVVLQRADGSMTRIRLNALSQTDQDWVKKARTAPPPGIPLATPRATGKSPSAGKPARALAPSAGDPAFAAKLKPDAPKALTAPGDHRVVWHITLPPAFNPAQPGPLLICFSPGGNGASIARQFKGAAHASGWTVIGVDKLKNGMGKDVDERAMEDEVFADILRRVPHNGKIVLGGFSGGAMRSYGLSHRLQDTTPIAGILAAGGWLGGADYQKRDYPDGMAVAIMNGNADRGARSWADRDAKALEGSKCITRKFDFEGGHKMPPENVLKEAIAWMTESWAK